MPPRAGTRPVDQIGSSGRAAPWRSADEDANRSGEGVASIRNHFPEGKRPRFGLDPPVCEGGLALASTFRLVRPFSREGQPLLPRGDLSVEKGAAHRCEGGADFRPREREGLEIAAAHRNPHLPIFVDPTRQPASERRVRTGVEARAMLRGPARGVRGRGRLARARGCYARGRRADGGRCRGPRPPAHREGPGGPPSACVGPHSGLHTRPRVLQRRRESAPDPRVAASPRVRSCAEPAAGLAVWTVPGSIPEGPPHRSSATRARTGSTPSRASSRRRSNSRRTRSPETPSKAPSRRARSRALRLPRTKRNPRRAAKRAARRARVGSS